MTEIVKQLDKLLESYDEFEIQSFDSSRLVLIGCWDLTYHHNVEVEFLAVSYIGCATYFNAQVFRLATPQENASIRALVGETVFCFESDGQTFLIAAQDILVREGLVLHYDSP